jgi:hypothetical protein
VLRPSMGGLGVREDVAVADSVVVRAQRLWEELAGGRFPGPGLARVIENPASRLCPSGWAGIVRIEASVLTVVGPRWSSVCPSRRCSVRLLLHREG